MDVLAKTYSVSVMAIFNSRIKLSADLEEVPSGVTSVLRFASATKDTNFASYEMSVSGTNSTLQTDTEQQIVEPKRPRDDEVHPRAPDVRPIELTSLRRNNCPEMGRAWYSPCNINGTLV